MWGVIEDAHFQLSCVGLDDPGRGMTSRAPLARRRAAPSSIGTQDRALRPAEEPRAAERQGPQSAAASTQSQAPPASDTSAVADAYRDQTSHYLGQAAALS